MKKRIYISPATIVMSMAHELPVATSNIVEGNSFRMNSSTMSEGDGGDATKGSGSWDVWDDEDE